MSTPKSPMSLHASTAAELPEVAVIWTAADELIAGGHVAGSAQGPYVTAYGIPADAIPSCKGWKPGSEQRVALSKSNEDWRATRFGWGRSMPGGTTPLYEWFPIGTLPDDVVTLADLCKHLIAKDPIRFPPAVYHEGHLAKRIIGNPAQMLFDFWENRKYRYATVSSGFDWNTYSTQPGSIPVRAVVGKGKDQITVPLTHVLGVVVVAPKAATAPGKAGQTQSVDELWKKIEPYLDALARHTARLESLLVTIDRVNRERIDVVGKLKVLEQVATCQVETNFDPAPWNNIRLWSGQIAEKLHKQAVELPIDTTGIALDAFDPKASTFGAICTPDARAAAETSAKEICSLLFSDSRFRDAIVGWLVPAVMPFLRGDDLVWERLDKLTGAVAAALYALASVGDADGATDDVLQKVEATQPGPAKSGDDITGDSAVAVLLALLGKSTKLAKGSALFAGPTSFRCATATAYATWKFQRLAAESWAQASALPATTQDVVLGMDGWKKYGNQLVDHLPPETQAKVKDVVAEGKLDELGALKKVVAEDVAKEYPVPQHLGAALAVLGFISTALSIRDFVRKPANRNVYLRALDWADVTVSTASYTLGTIDLFLKASARQSEATAATMARIGMRVNIASGIIAVIKGGVAYVAAAKRRDVYAGAQAWLDTTAGCASLLAVAAGVFGWTIPGLGQALLLFALLSGTLSIGDIARKSLPTSNQLVLAIVQSVAEQPITRYANLKDRNIGRLLDEMRAYVDISANPTTSAKLPPFPNDFLTVRSLRDTGLADDHIRMLVNHRGQPLAHSVLGFGLPPPAP